MSIDALLHYVRPEKIDLGVYDNPIGYILPNGLIMIKRNASRREQVETILHELFHLHPDFLPYTQRLWNGTQQRDASVESAIERRALEVYTTRPDIVSLIKKRLHEAENLPINQK